MVDKGIIEEWLAKADDDFDFARVNLEEGKTFYAQICFHFHQAAEKYLKAFIIAHELEFLRIHELPILLKTCCVRDSSFDQLKEACEFLTTFYVETRYPVHWPTHFTREEAQKAGGYAAKIKSLVKEKLYPL